MRPYATSVCGLKPQQLRQPPRTARRVTASFTASFTSSLPLALLLGELEAAEALYRRAMSALLLALLLAYY